MKLYIWTIRDKWWFVLRIQITKSTFIAKYKFHITIYSLFQAKCFTVTLTVDHIIYLQNLQ